MKFRVVFVLLALLAAGQIHASPETDDPLFAAFQAPAMDARPFVRWWWNGGRVDATEIRRELAVMQAAGIGGVEINTIGMPPEATEASRDAYPEVRWLTPEWNELVRVAAIDARARGMTADLLVGSGWPFGGQFLKPEQQTQRMRIVKHRLSEPGAVELTRAALMAAEGAAEKNDAGQAIPPTKTELRFLRLVAASSLAGPFAAGDELLPRLGVDGRIAVQVPPEGAVLYVGIWEQGFTHVKLGAPGADGPVVDHFAAAAVRTYLDNLSDRLSPVLEGNLGSALRAMFIDSLELDHANWTDDLPAEFRRRRGYDLTPYLPFVLDVPAPKDSGTVSEFARTVQRARYDFCLTLVELFDERFIATYRQWTEANHVKGRMQAYGRETHPLHGSMRVDLPEGESWLWADKFHPELIRVESTVVNKYVSSAANLTGRRLRSFEAMTNAVPVFRETLQDFKRCVDASFLAGLNHPLVHGFNYTPLEAGFPGWVRFGDYLNERNPWWPYFRQFSDYAARLGTVLRRSESPARVAVLAPRADEWAKHGLLIQPFPETADPWYQFKLIDAVQQAGFNADYLSEEILAAATLKDGKLTYGPCAYAVLIVADVESMSPASAEALAAFVAAGGGVEFVGRTPAHAPGLQDAAAADARVRAAFAQIQRSNSPRVHFRPAPVEDATPGEGRNETQLLTFARDLLAATGLPPDVAFTEPRWRVSQLSSRAGDRAIYFIANGDATAGAKVSATFPAATGRPYLWDPETGTRGGLAFAADGRLNLELAPAGSVLLVFEPGETPPLAPAIAPATRSPEARFTLGGPWHVRLQPAGGGPVSSFTLTELRPLGSGAPDATWPSFSGVATYEIDFDGAGLEDGVLDLGAVYDISDVELNGTALGSRWWGYHRYPLAGRILPGKNHLVIKVSTTLANLMRSLKDDAAAQRWAWWSPVIPTGLAGPVRLMQGPSPAPR